MYKKKLLIASSHENEAISKWILNNESVHTVIDLIFIDELLKEFEIMDELNDESIWIRWKRKDGLKYTNESHCLLNRIIYIDNELFSSFREKDRDYAKREFEAYLGFALNAFQSTQKQSINGVCERHFSLPQQWQLIKKHTQLKIPDYYWGSKQFNCLKDRDNVVHSDIYNYLLWSVNSKEQSPTGFSFIKPQGKPLFILSIGDSCLVTFDDELSTFEYQTITNVGKQIRKLFGYFIFELLLFVSEESITFGCINIDIIRSQKNPSFDSFLGQNLIQEYYQCLN